MQNLLGDLQTFSKDKLKKTSTTVKTVSGLEFRETKDDYGHIKAELTSHGGMGFVGDYKPDLQVAQVMPGLCFGEYFSLVFCILEASGSYLMKA